MAASDRTTKRSSSVEVNVSGSQRCYSKVKKRQASTGNVDRGAGSGQLIGRAFEEIIFQVGGGVDEEAYK